MLHKHAQNTKLPKMVNLTRYSSDCTYSHHFRQDLSNDDDINYHVALSRFVFPVFGFQALNSLFFVSGFFNVLVFSLSMRDQTGKKGG